MRRERSAAGLYCSAASAITTANWREMSTTPAGSSRSVTRRTWSCTGRRREEDLTNSARSTRHYSGMNQTGHASSSNVTARPRALLHSSIAKPAH